MASRNIIESNRAPSAIGPYSQAIAANGMIYTSGVVPLDPDTMEIVGSTIEEQTERVLQSLETLLEDAGTDLSRVVKTTCFLVDLGNYAVFNEIYAKYFGESMPARSAVGVAELPKAAMVEIEAVALAGTA